jgi:uncharacterized protein (TIGR02611 family)
MHLLKRFAVTLVGAVLLALGVAMMVLPGPGILVIVAGLAVLATEYVWAQRLLKRARSQAEKVQEAAVASPVRTAGTVLFGVVLLGLGLAMVFARDVDLPFWSPVTGGILAVTAAILLVTTYMTIRAARGEDTTHTGAHFETNGPLQVTSVRRQPTAARARS